MPVNFFSEDISFTLKEKSQIRSWLKQPFTDEGKKLKELNFIFCSDKYLLNINREFLKHDTYTDIVTFDNSESETAVVGDIFISLERVRENALKFKVSERDELHRVIIHGTLHLLGYSDKSAEQKKIMSAKEDYYLSLRQF